MDNRSFLAFSDTHGNSAALRFVFNWATEHGVETAVFLGDGCADIAPAAAETGFDCEWKKVRGNGDDDFKTPEADVFDYAGRRFFLAHGHRFALYNGYDTLAAAARNRQAGAALFGHTHIPCQIEIDGILLINPGSVGRPRSRIGASFAVIECPPGKPLSVRFLGIGPRGKIRELHL